MKIRNSTSELDFLKKETPKIDLRANVVLSLAFIGAVSYSSGKNMSGFDILNQQQLSMSVDKIEEYIDSISCYPYEIEETNYFDKSKIIEQILLFKSLENKWDGFSAVPTGVQCAVNAIKIIDHLSVKSLKKISDLYPNPNGTISIEWENNLEEVVSVEIGKDTFSYFVDIQNKEIEFFDRQYFNTQNFKSLDVFASLI